MDSQCGRGVSPNRGRHWPAIKLPCGDKIEQAVRLGFIASNNESEYEAILARVQLAATIYADKLIIRSDSQLVVGQVNAEYESRDPRMAKYVTFFAFYLFIIIIWIHGSYCLFRVRFCPKKIYLFSVYFILNELSSSHFLIFEIFVKISSLKSLTAHHLENRKNIPLVSEFDETFLGH